MGGKPRVKPEPGQRDQCFAVTAAGGIGIKLVLETTPPRSKIEAARIIKASFKRLGTPVEQRTPGGIKALRLDVIYKDGT